MIYLALTALWLIDLLRMWFPTRKKPIACNVCMAFWTVATLTWVPGWMLERTAALGVVLLVLRLSMWLKTGAAIQTDVLEGYVAPGMVGGVATATASQPGAEWSASPQGDDVVG